MAKSPEQFIKSSESNRDKKILSDFKYNVTAQAYAKVGYLGDKKYFLSPLLNLTPRESMLTALLIGKFTMQKFIEGMEQYKNYHNAQLKDPGTAHFARHIPTGPNFEAMIADLIKTKRAKPVYDKFIKLFQNKFPNETKGRAKIITRAIYELFEKSLVTPSELGDRVNFYISPEILSHWLTDTKGKLLDQDLKSLDKGIKNYKRRRTGK